MKKSVLFVCVENSNRSQMAEAFARIYAGDQLEVCSAGSKPSRKVNPKAIKSMEKKGYDLSTHRSMGLEEIPSRTWDVLVGMGCGEECPWVPAKERLDWDLPDPGNMNEEEFDNIRDAIEQNVKELLNRLI